MSLGPLPATDVMGQRGERWSALWLTWVNGVQQWLAPQGGFGASSTRPTKGLYINLSFFDTTLGKPIFVKQVTPTIIWVDATGGAV
jgi:hypothetical protein